MSEACENCLYFTEGTNWRGKPKGSGICRVGPRMPAATGMVVVSYTWEYPEMYANDWCGCWESDTPVDGSIGMEKET